MDVHPLKIVFINICSHLSHGQYMVYMGMVMHPIPREVYQSQ